MNEMNEMNEKEVRDPMTIYVVVRRSLGMSPGKMAAQVAHAVKRVLLDSGKNALIDAWRASPDEAICVLEADENEWMKVLALPGVFATADRGFVEVTSGTHTAAAFLPMLKSERPKLLRRLRLLTYTTDREDD